MRNQIAAARNIEVKARSGADARFQKQGLTAVGLFGMMSLRFLVEQTQMSCFVPGATARPISIERISGRKVEPSSRRSEGSTFRLRSE